MWVDVLSFLKTISLPVLTVMLAVLFIYKAPDTQYSRVLSLVTELAWPAVMLFAVLFFRKIFAYLFLSMEEFNFFGAKGRLRDVQEVISEKAKQLNIEEKSKKEFEDIAKKAKEAMNSNEEMTKLLSKLLTLYKMKVEEFNKLKEGHAYAEIRKGKVKTLRGLGSDYRSKAEKEFFESFKESNGNGK